MEYIHVVLKVTYFGFGFREMVLAISMNTNKIMDYFSLLEGCAFLKEITDEFAILEDGNDTQEGGCTEQHLNQVESQVKLEPPRINISKSTLSSNAECH